MNTLETICRFTLVVLANAAWQVAAIGLLTFVTLRLGRIRSPQCRSGVCVAGLLAVLACPLLTTLSQQAGLHIAGLTWESPIAPTPPTMPLRMEASIAPPPATGEPVGEPAIVIPRMARQQHPAVEAPPPHRDEPSVAIAAPHTLTLQQAIVAFYVLGVIALLARLAVGELYLSYLRWAASPAPGQLNTTLQRLSWQARLWKRVRIGLSAKVATPVLVGVVRPTILMPMDLADLPDAHVEAILLHEIAHVRRRDGLVNLLQRLAEGVLFFHPVIWLLGRELRLQRERCCDAWVIEQTGRELDYARCLTDLAERLTTNWKLMPRVAMAEFRHELPRRVMAVLDGSARTARNLPRWARNLAIVTALLTAGTVSVCGLTVANQRPAATQPTATQPTAAPAAAPPIEPWQGETDTVRIKIVDEDAKPVPGVRIEPDYLRTKTTRVMENGRPTTTLKWGNWGNNSPVPASPIVTDAKGIATVVYPKYLKDSSKPGTKQAVDCIGFNATHPDYPPTRSPGYDVTGTEPFVLKKGATLRASGYIGNTTNTVPIKVQVTRIEVPLPDDAWQDAGNNVQMSRLLPAGKHYVRLIHLPEDGLPQFSDAVLLAAQAGKEYTLNLEIKPGVRVEGKLDASVPRPVRNGKLIGEAGPADLDTSNKQPWDWRMSSPRWMAEASIAEDGTFVLPSMPAGQLRLIALCDGYLSSSNPPGTSPGIVNPQFFTISGSSTQVELAMEPTATCQIRVIDEQGEPVEGASVSFVHNMDFNDRVRILAGTGALSEDILRNKTKGQDYSIRSMLGRHNAKTNADGMAVVKDLPGTQVKFSVAHEKYEVPAAAGNDTLPHRTVPADLSPGKTTTLTVTVQPKGKDGETGPTRSAEQSASDPAPATRPTATQPAAANPAQPAAPALEPLESEVGTASVRVVDEDGKPVAGVKIQPNGLRTKIESASHYGWGSNPVIPAIPALTNADGVATVTYPKYIGAKLEVGYITFLATHPDYAPASSSKYAVDGGDKLVLKKGATLRVSGYIGDKGNVVPVKAQVTGTEAPLDDDAWQDLGGGILMTRRLSPGKHYVRLIRLPQDGPAQFSEAVVLEAQAGKEYTLNLEIRPGVRVEGKLDASVPRPVHNGWIIASAGPVEPEMDKRMPVWFEWTRLAPRWQVEVPIAEDGAFVLPSLPAGQLQLIGVCEGYLSKSPTLAHSPGVVNPQVFPISGQAAQVELAMEPGATCEVHVVDEQGQPVEGAKVVFWPNYRINGGANVLHASGRSSEDSLRGKAKEDPADRWRNAPAPYQATTNADGVAVVKGLPALKESFGVTHEKYELPAVAGFGQLRRRYATAELSAGKTTVVTVAVQPKGKDSLTDPLRPGEKPPVPQPAPAGTSAIRLDQDPKVLNDYVGKIVPDGERTEFHGRVVDEAGQPIEGVLVDAWTWHKGNETHTDQDGNFQLKKLDIDRRVEVRFSKDGYTPRYIVQQPTGVQDAVVVLGTKTYFEGTVTDPAGQPVAGAQVRVTPPPQRADGVMLREVWTEARTDESGRYRLYVQQGTYEFQVQAAAGMARLKGIVLAKDQAATLDIRLQPGLVFRAKVVDSQTGEPAEGLQLHDHMHRKVLATSDANGLVEITGMLPGKFQCWPDGAGYVRWWSEQCVNEWQRFQKESRPGSQWQRNFDPIEFDLQPDMEPVTIQVEKGVRIRGKVLDPEGDPVAGATVAPALTGTGNSLTGDTRFSVTTTKDGTFEMLLPASKDRDYNLVAHDGKFGQWRTWANGVNPPLRTKPGDQIDDVVLTLTRPATVRGKVLDKEGKPVADREVRASAVDNLENRYYNPTTRTAKDGTFELKFVRPTRQYIQVAPFWLQAQEAPKGTSAEVTLGAGQVLGDVSLTAVEQRR